MRSSFLKMAVPRSDCGDPLASLSWFYTENIELFEARSRVFKVADIFKEAGIAFNKLSEMAMLLQTPGMWSDEDVEMLRFYVHRCALDLNKLSQHIKNRTASQVRATHKKKTYGIPVRQVTRTVTSAGPAHSLMVTRSMLNAPKNKDDDKGTADDIKRGKRKGGGRLKHI